ELSEQALQASFIESNVRIDLTVGTLKVSVRDQAGPTVAGPRDIDHVEVVLLDRPVQVDIDEVQTWRRSPMAEQPRLDMCLGERLLEQRIVIEIDLANRQVVGSSPIPIDRCSLFLGQAGCHLCLLIGLRLSIAAPAAAVQRIIGTSWPGLHLVRVLPGDSQIVDRILLCCRDPSSPPDRFTRMRRGKYVSVRKLE